MSASGNKHVVRMGPITVLTLVIVLSLATMAVLSLATAQAASRMADKQETATLALYSNEREAQAFLEQFDGALQPYRAQHASVDDALKGIVGSIEGIVVNENTVEKSFVNGTRTLTVKLSIQDDLGYTIEGWKTTTELETQEGPVLWQGNTARGTQDAPDNEIERADADQHETGSEYIGTDEQDIVVDEQEVMNEQDAGDAEQ